MIYTEFQRLSNLWDNFIDRLHPDEELWYQEYFISSGYPMDARIVLFKSSDMSFLDISYYPGGVLDGIMIMQPWTGWEEQL